MFFIFLLSIPFLLYKNNKFNLLKENFNKFKGFLLINSNKL